jgi:hypothetical protein
MLPSLFHQQRRLIAFELKMEQHGKLNCLISIYSKKHENANFFTCCSVKYFSTSIEPIEVLLYRDDAWCHTSKPEIWRIDVQHEDVEFFIMHTQVYRQEFMQLMNTVWMNANRTQAQVMNNATDAGTAMERWS